MARPVQKKSDTSAPKKKSKIAGGNPEKLQKIKYEITTIATIAVGLIVGISFIPNVAGAFGDWFRGFFIFLLGEAASYIIPLTIVALGVLFVLKREITKYGYKYFLGSILLIIISVFCSYYWENGGGWLGTLFAIPLKQATGIVGGILLIALLLVMVVVIFEVSITRCFIAIGKGFRKLYRFITSQFFGEVVEYDDVDDSNLSPQEREVKQIDREIKNYNKNKKKIIDFDIGDPVTLQPEPVVTEVFVPEDYDEPEPENTPVLAEPLIPEKPIEQQIHEEMAVSVDRHVNYKLPPISLLAKLKEINAEKQAKELKNTAEKLIHTLANFNVEAKIVDYSMGPSITRYELQPGPGVKISKISGLSDDIALNLAAMGVRIEAPIPGKAAIGIEIPNKTSVPVNIREIISHPDFATFPSKLAFALGKDIAGIPVIADIARMPHLLVAGSTGSGKSVCINSLITSLLYKALPDEVKLIMIDPKMVELGRYNGIPHLLIPVVTNPQKAAGALQWAVKEMTDRYKQFADNGVRDLKSYNNLAENRDMPKMPQIVIIIDELADLMMVAPNDVEDSICRLAQMARAAGMHLVIATQRPSVDVITGIIKANIPSRISFAVSSQIDSRTILDSVGAEKLLGRGDMLYAPIGSNKPIRLQGPFVSDEEVETVVDFVKNQMDEQQQYDPDIIEVVENFEIGSTSVPDPEASGKADELLPQAIEMAIETGQASVAMYQRRLKVGYQRAARLIDQMESRGIIGPFDGTKPRQVLINRAQFNEMMMNSNEY